MEAGHRGLRIVPIGVWDVLLSDGAVALSALWMLAALIGGGVVIGQKPFGVASLPIGLTLLVLAVIGGVPVIVNMLGEIAAYALFIVLVPLLPLLLFPGVRRALRGKGKKAKESLTVWRAVDSVRTYDGGGSASASASASAGPVVDIRFADGAVIRLSASGKKGAALVAELGKLSIGPRW
ncbi:hypothetical protein Afil01_45530 [Actinorhabdospora filicis]|uniref:Uncharacterized protein n=1 Tax=Actinorhabdospora filicis TaxID=1785913 RepID=A0A9W6WBN3_9ACTN|nr:hypothetical protein Afil01_45530 [Actinorhabdospora filicis]